MRYKLEKDKLSDEFKFLLSLIAHSKENKFNSEMNWELFVRLVRHHRLYPVVYGDIQSIGERELPNFVIAELKEEYSRNTFKMFALTGEMDRVNKLFAENSIRSLILKGPPLAQTLFGDVSRRTSKDLDILVPVENFEQVNEILMQDGYIPKKKFVPDILGDWKRRRHHLSYFNPKKQVQIEIHWRMNPEMGCEPSFEDLWLRRQKSNLTGSDIFLLSNEDLFSYLIMHGARHGWFRLRWLLDIHYLLSVKNINWRSVSDGFIKNGQQAIAGQTLILLHSLFKTEVPLEMEYLLDARKSAVLAERAMLFIIGTSDVSVDSEDRDLVREYQRYLFAIKTSKQKWEYVRERLLPNSYDANTLYLPRTLHFLYYPLRPFLWFWRRVKEQLTT
ncbi:hypothetical protein FHS18_000598 [Paenibacillus phyllosphaerae]|uniref:Renal dipeptidase n=1 Tax=Paenibacillus phyllosphaerae TaxID=274593 RepID=A0A7W5ATN0_9BACL|nr:nucleotidyltransferase family protein [Paenibacillus phyllosphaerae]MBB3108570.1 hypothetical protein [Paenibacillus phyllosphaerae]